MSTPEAGKELSPAELKKKAKAEKQARRAAQKEQQGGASVVAGPANNQQRQNEQSVATSDRSASSSARRVQLDRQSGGSANGSAQGSASRQTPSQHGSLPVRRRGSVAAVRPRTENTQKKDNKVVELFSHLYTQPRRHTYEGVSKDVHPSVLTLGFQISSYEIAGSTARCVGMLLAFKDAIKEYTTPSGTSLARHMTSHFLSPQIDYLKSCRPISESMGNAIRWLKKLIVEIDPSTGEQEAKDYLCENIDRFIQERITFTDTHIANEASKQIKNGAVVLTFAKSALAEKVLLQAKADGHRFRVIVVDSRPLFEGKNLALSLTRADIQVEYLAFAGLQHAISQATVVLLGAHSLLSNGRLQSRIGTASVALAATRAGIPVIVCCESVKFSGKSVLDSIVLNEVAPAEELLLSQPAPTVLAAPSAERPEETSQNKLKSLHDWRDIPNLQILNLMYDVTPAECITLVVCEYGNVPPTSVPAVHRLANEGE